MFTEMIEELLILKRRLAFEASETRRLIESEVGGSESGRNVAPRALDLVVKMIENKVEQLQELQCLLK